MINFIYKYRKLLFLSIVVALLLFLTIYFSVGNMKPSSDVTFDNLEFVADEFVDINHILEERDFDNHRLVAENKNFELYFDEETTYLTVVDKRNGVTWSTNPNANDPLAQGDDQLRQKSTIEIEYTRGSGSGVKYIYNYNFSINQEVMGGVQRGYFIRYTDQGVQVLYEIKNRGVTDYWFPQRLTEERFKELFTENEEFIEKGDVRRITEYYKFKINERVYELENYGRLGQRALSNLYTYFYEINNYTIEMLEEDSVAAGSDFEFLDPHFKVAIDYRLTEDGLKATVINDSIFESGGYIITGISLLPNFGAASKDDEGYFVIPDGSGAIMNFNNGKTYVPPYSKRYYGLDLALLPEVKPEAREELLLPLFGIVNQSKESGVLAIIEKGAPQATLQASVSSSTSSYNRIGTRFAIRESELSLFVNRGERYFIATYTKDPIATDFVIEYQIVDSERANYVGLAKQYRDYLIKHHGLEKRDYTTQTVLNITILGMYETQEFFLGIPYKTTRTLTTFEQAQAIIEDFKQKGMTDINLIYNGWFNDSLEHEIASHIKVNRIMGGKKGLNHLKDYLDAQSIDLYPLMNIMYSSGYRKAFDRYRYTAKHINGKASMLNEYNFATKLRDPSKELNYILSPRYYRALVDEMMKEYEKLSLDAIGFNDLGAYVSGHYNRRKDVIYRSEAIHYQLEVLEKLSQNYRLLMHSPLGFAAPYASLILELPIEATKYPILDESIPFYQLVFSGYIDYSSISVNENNELGDDYHFLKAIETGSNLGFILSYQDSSVLLNTDFNYYYSVNYRNWLDRAVAMVEELNRLKIHESPLVYHEIIAPDVVKVAYENGQTFVINYRLQPFTYEDQVIESRGYIQIGGDLQ